MHFVTNLFPVMGVQNLSKSVKLPELLTKVCCHVFYAPKCISTFAHCTVYTPIDLVGPFNRITALNILKLSCVWKKRSFIRAKTVTHPSTNRVRRSATSLITTNTLPL